MELGRANGLQVELTCPQRGSLRWLRALHKSMSVRHTRAIEQLCIMLLPQAKFIDIGCWVMLSNAV